jgi:hypothetical protein
VIVILTTRVSIATVAVLAGGSLMSGQAASPPDSDGWISLFNGKNFDGWYTFLPSTGKNSDPKKVFKMENGMVHILDIPESDEKQEFGYLSSEREFSNCRIRVEFQWGAKRFVPNNENKSLQQTKVRQCADSRGILHALHAQCTRPGARQQRCVLAGPVRDPDSGFL